MMLIQGELVGVEGAAIMVLRHLIISMIFPDSHLTVESRYFSP